MRKSSQILKGRVITRPLSGGWAGYYSDPQPQDSFNSPLEAKARLQNPGLPPAVRRQLAQEAGYAYATA